MSQELRRRLFEQLDALTLVDPHTHINPLEPASRTLADILGYHYYTELAHSAGLAKDRIEDPDLTPREKVGRLIENLGPIDNTIQWSWLLEMAQKLFGFEGDQINADNWESLFDAADDRMASAEWAQQVLDTSKVRSVFLTNNFDDDLEGFDTSTYIPCLRTDDLVFHLAKSETQQRLERTTGVTLSDANSLRDAIGTLFDTFTNHGARACAISLPPDFAPTHVSEARADTAIEAMLSRGVDCGESHRRAVANFAFWTLAEYCNEYRMPFDLMIGVNRDVYPGGVHQGRDLYDSRVSLIQYKELFNAFPGVTFPISVLASVTNQELVSYSWIFPNVVTNGHWWYSNTPSYIEHDLAARLEGVPRTKQIGYYSDAYKLEFVLPKFAMYKRILAKVLAERFVIDRGWSEERAFELGKQVLAGNTHSVFTEPQRPTVPMARSRESRLFSREISMNESQAAAAAGTLGTFYNERIEPDSITSGDAEGDDLSLGMPVGSDDVEMVGSNDLGPIDLDERSQDDQGELASFISQEAGGSGSNVLDRMELESSFSDEDLQDEGAIQPLDAFPADETDTTGELQADDVQPLDLQPTDLQAEDDLQPLDELETIEDGAEENLPPPEENPLLLTSSDPVTLPLGSTDSPPELEELNLEEEAPLELENVESDDSPWGQSTDAEPSPAEPVSAAEEAWSPFKSDEGASEELPTPAENADELEELQLDAIDEGDEITPIQLDDDRAAEKVEEDEFTGFEIVADEQEDPNKTMPFQLPDQDQPKKDSGGWDFLSGGKG